MEQPALDQGSDGFEVLQFDELSQVASGRLALVPILSAHASRIRADLACAGGAGPEAPATAIALAQESFEGAHELSVELASCVTALPRNPGAMSPAPENVRT